ncbi:ROK family protein [Melittangium boletus]|uniref:Chromosome partitioning protein ParA n=1 Tax=Melittangium boletus DSM 14713 TaxID=1294270 RepID=A0A250IJE3_9BACT|nr:ROK family protein [Melittangium boletus]ATB31302.1 chromosome partitioning protein ParA [Melittangium boletus DSM 14713]
MPKQATPEPSPRKKTARETRATKPRTLAIDIGGSGLKALVLDPQGKALDERQRVKTPRPATPKSVLSALEKLIQPLGGFERVSVGFPGVVEEGVTRTAPNLHPDWAGFDLEGALHKLTRRPVRVLNDAGVQGFGVIEGRGVEMVLTLGTGMGCALYVDGKYVPNLELAHHPLQGKKTYEDYVGQAALERVGKKKWNKHVRKVLDQIQPIWNPRKIYVGGGNARLLDFTLPKNTTVTDNVAGLLGGFALWKNEPVQQ